MAAVQVGQRVKTTDGSKAGTHPTGSQGTVLAVTTGVTRNYGGVSKTLDEALVQFDGRLQANLQIVGSLS